MTDSDLRAIERGHVCRIHKVILQEDDSCLDCDNEIPAWQPMKRQYFPLHEFPFGAIGAFLWWLIAIGSIIYFGFGHLFGWR